MNEVITHCFGLTENPEIVETLKTSVIKNIVKGYNAQTLVNYLREKPDIDNYDIFNSLPATVFFYLENNDIIGFNIDESKKSVVSWYDVRQGVKFNTEYHNRKRCDYMPYDHAAFSPAGNWKYIVGSSLSKVSVIECDVNEKWKSKDSFQKAIILETESDNMVLSMLSGLSRPFQIIRKAQVPQDIWDISTIIEL